MVPEFEPPHQAHCCQQGPCFGSSFLFSLCPSTACSVSLKINNLKKISGCHHKSVAFDNGSTNKLDLPDVCGLLRSSTKVWYFDFSNHPHRVRRVCLNWILWSRLPLPRSTSLRLCSVYMLPLHKWWRSPPKFYSCSWDMSLDLRVPCNRVSELLSETLLEII